MNKKIKKMIALALGACLLFSSIPGIASTENSSASPMLEYEEETADDVNGTEFQDNDDAEVESAILLPEIGNADQNPDSENSEGDDRDTNFYVIGIDEQETEPEDRDLATNVVGEEKLLDDHDLAINFIGTDQEAIDDGDDRGLSAVSIFNAPGSMYIYGGVKAGFRVSVKTTFVIATSPGYSVQIGSNGKVYYNGDTITLNPNTGTNYYPVTASGNCTFRLSVAPTVDVFYAPGSRYVYGGVKAGFRISKKAKYKVTTNPGYSVQIGSNGNTYYNGDTLTLNANEGTNYYPVTASGNCTLTISEVPAVEIFNAPGSKYLYSGLKAGFRVSKKAQYKISVSPGYGVQIGTSGKYYYNGDILTLNANAENKYYPLLTSGNCSFSISEYTREYHYVPFAKTFSRGQNYYLKVNSDGVYTITLSGGGTFNIGSNTYSSGKTLKFSANSATSHYRFVANGSGTCTVTVEGEYGSVAEEVTTPVYWEKTYSFTPRYNKAYRFATDENSTIQIIGFTSVGSSVRVKLTAGKKYYIRVTSDGRNISANTKIAVSSVDFVQGPYNGINRGFEYHFKPQTAGYYKFTWTGGGNFQAGSKDKNTNKRVWTRKGSSTVEYIGKYNVLEDERYYPIRISGGSGNCDLTITPLITATGAFSQTVTLPYTLKMIPTNANLFEISATGNASLSIGSKSHTMPHQTSLKAGGSYTLEFTGTGQSNILIKAGCTADTSAILYPLTEYHNGYTTGGSCLIDATGVSEYYQTALEGAAADITNQTDFNADVNLTTPGNGWTVMVGNFGGDSLASVKATNATWNAATMNWIQAKTDQGEFKINESNLTTVKYSQADCREIFMHEIGHIAGLRDLKKPYTSYDNIDMKFHRNPLGIEYGHWVMYGSYGIGRTEDDFSASEIAAINDKISVGNSRSSSLFGSIANVENFVITNILYIHNDLSSVVRNSDYVVVGTIKSIGEPVDNGIDVYRLANITVNEDLKGNAPQNISIRLYGGKLNGINYIYESEANFEVGDEVAFTLINREDRDSRSLSGVGLTECSIAGGEFAYEIDERDLSSKNNITIIDVLKAELAQYK